VDDQPDTPREPRVGVNWLAILIVLGLFGISAILARSFSTEAGVVTFVVGLLVMWLVAVRTPARTGDAGDWPPAFGDDPGWDGDSGSDFGGGGGGGD
jgi:hypothetical protein